MNSSKFDSVVVLASPRTGSNWLIQVLQSNPDAAVYGELCKADFYSADKGAARVCKELNLTPEAAQEHHTTDTPFIVTSLAARAKSLNKLFGFKIFYSHTRGLPVLKDGLLGNKVGLIHLYRNNIFDSFTSLKLARGTGVWLNGTYGDVKLEFDEQEYLKYRDIQRAEFKEWQTWISSSNSLAESIDVEYSEIGSDALLDRIAAFVGLPEQPPQPSMQKQAERKSLDYWASEAIKAFAEDKLTA